MIIKPRKLIIILIVLICIYILPIPWYNNYTHCYTRGDTENCQKVTGWTLYPSLFSFHLDSFKSKSQIKQREVPSIITTPPSQPSTDRQMGYIKSITNTNGQISLTIDYALMLDGDDVIAAMVSDGKCQNASDCQTNNGYYIQNNDFNLQTFVVNVDTKVQFSILSNYQVMSIDEFQKIFSFNSDDYRKNFPYWITLDNGNIISIEEQYLP